MRDKHNNLHRTILQVLEWIYGQTNITYPIMDCSIARVPDHDDQFAFLVVTNSVRPNYKHPMALLVDTIHLSITGTCVLDDQTIPPDADNPRINVTEDDLTCITLRQDQGGFSVISVQFLLGLHDGGEHGMSRQFLFRGNLLNSVR